MNAEQQTMRQPVLSQLIFADRIVEVGLSLAIVAGFTEIISGFGTQWEWWYFRTGFALLRVGAMGGSIAAVISLVGGVLARHEHRRMIFFAAAAGILIGLIT